MRTALDKLRREPALVSGVVVAVVALAGAFGVPVTDEQSAAIVGVVVALVALAGAIATRTQVTPVKHPPAADGTPSATSAPERPDLPKGGTR